MTLKWGICGTGKICGDFVQAVQTLPVENHQVVAVGSRTISNAETFANVHQIPKFLSYDNFFQLQEIDVVYIGVLNVAHKDCVLRALKAGKHVLCEKPLTAAPEDVTEIIEAATTSGKFIMEGYWSLYMPPYCKLIDMLNDGTIGTPTLLNASFCRIMEPEVMAIENSGGGMLSIGYYLIALSVIVFNEYPLKIEARGITKKGVDTAVLIKLEFSGNRVAQLYNSTTFDGQQEAVIEGTLGSFKIDHPFFCPTSATIFGTKHSSDIPKSDWVDGKQYCYPNTWGLRFEAEHVRQCISQGLTQSPVWPLINALHVSKITCEVLKQVEYGKICD